MKKRVFRTLVSLVLIISLIMSCTACGFQVQAAELSQGYERKATEEGTVSEAFKTAMADFSMTLFKKTVTNDSENDLVSPLSAIICLAMLANGTGGETRAQMESALGMDIDSLNKALYAYTSSLYTAKDCKLNIADSLWIRDVDGMHVNAEFLQANADWYDAKVYSAPFDGQTVKDINSWCKEYTDGMIEKMIDEIDPNAVAYLINALSFDAKWAEKYERDNIFKSVFTNYDATETKVTMLSSKEDIYLPGENYKGFIKKYSGDKYGIMCLLPEQETDIYDFIASLDGTAWMNIFDSRENYQITAKLPEFSYSSNMQLKDTLRAMGMEDMFDDAKADFSKLGSCENGNIYCSEVDQKVYIEVDRNGTKAASINWAGMFAKSAAPCPIILDRPFVYAIVDLETGLPVFVGAVTQL